MVTENLATSLKNPARMFAERTLVVASMHGKHHVMEPLIKKFLHIDSIVVPDFDTDEFGTFSGEVERSEDAIATLRKKILKGLSVSGETIGIGTEGSFGPHPQIPFIPANQEHVMLIDLENNIEIIETLTCTDTNHGQAEINNLEEIIQFADKVGFPSHGLVLKKLENDEVVAIRKGIVTWELLYQTMLRFSSPTSRLIAETDMRAYNNPTRMKVIEQATELLMKKVTNLCPECQWPGFGVADVRRGLPCRSCGEPTRLIISQVYHCENCSYTDERYHAHGQKADPQYCDHCNP